jgi:peptidoglycan/LPS O-acetylase OafA/YrhL
MKNQTGETRPNSFKFSFPRLQEAAEGLGFWATSALAFWIPTIDLCNATRTTDTIYFMFCSHLLGIPIGVWLLQHKPKPLRVTPEQGSAKILSFAEHTERKKADHDRKAA